MKTEQYRTIKLKNNYSSNDIDIAFPILNKAGIKTSLNNGDVILDFDVVDMKYIEKQNNCSNEML